MFCCNPTQWMSSVWYVCLRVFYFSLIFRIVVCVWCRWLSSCLFHVFVYVFFPFFSCVCCLSCSRAIRFLWNWFKRNSWVEDAYTANSWVFHSSRGTRTDSSASATIIRNGKYIGCSFVLERRLIRKSQNMPCTAYRSMSLLFLFHELLFFLFFFHFSCCLFVCFCFVHFLSFHFGFAWFLGLYARVIFLGLFDAVAAVIFESWCVVCVVYSLRILSPAHIKEHREWERKVKIRYAFANARVPHFWFPLEL